MRGKLHWAALADGKSVSHFADYLQTTNFDPFLELVFILVFAGLSLSDLDAPKLPQYCAPILPACISL